MLSYVINLMTSVITIVSLLALTLCKSPPTFNYSYQVAFSQTLNKQKATHTTTGQLFYDPINNRQRVDWANGQHNFICSSIHPNIATPCITLVVDNKRWEIFPQRSECCLCCTSQKGCGVLRPDWLRQAKYEGEVSIDGVNYDQWHMTGASTEDYAFVSQDQLQLERRMVEKNQFQSRVTDYDLRTFERKQFADSVFGVPSYCHENKPNRCPLTSACSVLSKMHPADQQLIIF